MSDLEKKSGEGSTKGEVDLTKYVPKEDFEKVSKESKESVSKLQEELDQAKLSLLDPEYIAFRESKQGKALNKEVKGIEKELKSGNLSEAKAEELENRLNTIAATQENILAVLELQAVEKKYDDFQDFRDSTRKILETSTTPLTIEQAYLLAKGTAKTEKSDDVKKRSAKTGSEKPSGTILEPDKQKDFTDKKAAAEDAWDKVVGAGKDTL